MNSHSGFLLEDERQRSLSELVECWKNAPEPSNKNTSYFGCYVELFHHLRGTACTFIEIGVQNGGSLHMWRKWLGDQARIIGIDLNPAVAKWRDHGFEIYIGDQGDSNFWASAIEQIGDFDALLDDGGHQSFQQILSVQLLLKNRKNKCLIVVEDTGTSFMKDFARHEEHSFLEYAKDATDCLTGRVFATDPTRFPDAYNQKNVDFFENVFSIRFFSCIVAFYVDPTNCLKPLEITNKVGGTAGDFRYEGKDQAVVEWPDILQKKTVLVKGGSV